MLKILNFLIMNKSFMLRHENRILFLFLLLSSLVVQGSQILIFPSVVFISFSQILFCFSLLLAFVELSNFHFLSPFIFLLKLFFSNLLSKCKICVVLVSKSFGFFFMKLHVILGLLFLKRFQVLLLISNHCKCSLI